MTEREAQVEKFHAWLALDPFRDGITIREIAIAERAWQASRKQALEEAAKECDGLRDDAKEVEALAKFKGASASGNTRDELDRGEFWLTVSTFNAGLRRAATAIRSLTTTPGEAA